MGKWLAFISFSLLCLTITMIPEMVMWFCWHLIQPETDVARIAMIGLFWFGGGGLCVLFGFFGFMVWLAGISEIF